MQENGFLCSTSMRVEGAEKRTKIKFSSARHTRTVQQQFIQYLYNTTELIVLENLILVIELLNDLHGEAVQQ